MAVVQESFCYDLLHRWQIRMQEDAWNFNQILNSDIDSFEGVYLQNEREMIGHGITEAFEIVASHLGYSPKPVYVVDRQIALKSGVSFYRQGLTLHTRHLQGFGIRATTLIEAGASFTASDSEEGDGINDTATFTITTDVTASEIQLFYTVSDGAPSVAHRQWRIPTVSVSTSSGTATIVVRRANLTAPVLWDDPYADGGRNGGDIGNASTDIVTSVDVYRVYTSTTSAVRLLSKPIVNGQTTVDETAVDAIITDPNHSEFYLSDDASPPAIPYAIRVSYLAGLGLELTGEMNTGLEKAIVRLANIESGAITTPMSSGTEYIWNNDTKLMFANDYEAPEEYKNPLGLQRAHIESWLTIKRLSDPILGGTAVRRSW